eukprot:CAMPEP_0178467170 /NCGR_PEP_ID=MMETSP0689_2-20121128/52277_1 /TAXON_ID=160604 /ORGANISM="Amphidinium massartii, Strain CS-259" /LENGTH=103 /DNA_ID=CAMNT_0020094209 /DNA_START=214 /DNA_END=525 /DNA_ORIENTATION=+
MRSQPSQALCVLDVSNKLPNSFPADVVVGDVQVSDTVISVEELLQEDKVIIIQHALLQVDRLKRADPECGEVNSSLRWPVRACSPHGPCRTHVDDSEPAFGVA